MKIRYYLFFAGFLLALNVFAWQEVFVLASGSNLRIVFFDVGQGDAAFIITPENHQILIDGGPDSSVLTEMAKEMPFWDRTLDLIILTHPEKDHMMGILDVLEKYKADYFLWAGVVKDDAENKKLAQILQKSAVAKVITAQSGEKIRAGSVLIDVLFPFDNLAGKELKGTSNDAGVVSKIIFGKNSFLFVGDISSAVENRLANSHELVNLKSDVLKVAHHGSKYSSSELFLENVKPKIAVISVGKNSYGHPTSEVLQRLSNFGIQIKRTDIDGDIEILSDGQKIYVSNF